MVYGVFCLVIQDMIVLMHAPVSVPAYWVEFGRLYSLSRSSDFLFPGALIVISRASIARYPLGVVVLPIYIPCDKVCGGRRWLRH